MGHPRGIIALALGLPLLLIGCAENRNFDHLDAPSQIRVHVTDEYSSVARVIGPGGLTLCTGTFISENAVITAAHCTETPGTYTILGDFGMLRSAAIRRFGPGTVDDPNDIAILILDGYAPEDYVVGLGAAPDVLDHVRLVGYGCNSLATRSGAGIKRTGTNQLYRRAEYLEVVTPLTEGGHGLLGPVNRAGSCFGDSGGPMFLESENGLELVGIAHTGSWNKTYSISQYGDLNRYDNLRFLRETSDAFDLGLFDLCDGEPDMPAYCDVEWSSVQIIGVLKWLWAKLLAFFGW